MIKVLGSLYITSMTAKCFTSAINSKVSFYYIFGLIFFTFLTSPTTSPALFKAY
uniref:Uncharacterized protein n=1 Tax=Clostridium argentinense TaxID=29341 RepID=A0A7I6N961_9CLOT|nr:hypothetical protein [Clostridium argentinense]